MARERAALGDDAAQFASVGDNAALRDDEDDLLGGGDYSGGHDRGEDVTEFESSFPAIDTRNEASKNGLLCVMSLLTMDLASRARWVCHRHWYSRPSTSIQ